MLFGLFGKKNEENTSSTWPATGTEEKKSSTWPATESVPEEKAPASTIPEAPAVPVVAETPVTPVVAEVPVASVDEKPVEVVSPAEAASPEASDDDIQDVIAPLPVSKGAEPGSLQARFPYLDVEQGMSYCGMMEDFYLEMMGDFMEVDEPEQMQKYFEAEDWANYRIHAHALKSTARTIGAIRMSERALGLEEAAKEEDGDYIRANHQKVLDANVVLGTQLQKDLNQ